MTSANGEVQKNKTFFAQKPNGQFFYVKVFFSKFFEIFFLYWVFTIPKEIKIYRKNNIIKLK